MASRRCGCLEGFFILVFLILVGLLVFVTIKPKKPLFHLQQVTVHYFNVSTHSNSSSSSPSLPPKNTTTAAYLSLNLIVRFTMENRNKMRIKYFESIFNVMYKEVLLDKMKLPKFKQPAHVTALVEWTVRVDRLRLLNDDAINLLRDVAHNGSLEIRINAEVYTVLVFLGLPSRYKGSAVDCWIVISPTKLSATSMQCSL